MLELPKHRWTATECQRINDRHQDVIAYFAYVLMYAHVTQQLSGLDTTGAYATAPLAMYMAKPGLLDTIKQTSN